MKKLTVVLTGAAVILIAIMTLLTTSARASEASSIWVENDAVNLYRDPTANEFAQPEFWTLRAKSGHYWNNLAKSWGMRWHANFGVAVKDEYAFPLNNTDVECPNEFMFRRYTLTWGQEAVGIGAGHIPNVQWYHYLMLFLLGSTEETSCDCYGVIPTCNNDGYCGAGETKENCPNDCHDDQTTTTTTIQGGDWDGISCPILDKEKVSDDGSVVVWDYTMANDVGIFGQTKPDYNWGVFPKTGNVIRITWPKGFEIEYSTYFGAYNGQADTDWISPDTCPETKYCKPDDPTDCHALEVLN